MRASLAAVIAVLSICASPLGGAQAARGAQTAYGANAQSAALHVTLAPDRPGASTTIAFGFQIAAVDHALPSALTRLAVRLPAGMGVDTTGLATCRAALLVHGPRGCSRNAQVGSGSVDVKVPLGDVVRLEKAALTVFNAPRRHGRTALLFYAAGRLPIATQLVFTGVIVLGPLGQTIEAAIPLIPTLPEAPDAAIVAMASTLGTRQLTYYRTVGNRRVRIAPKGATLPARCPAGGFPFAASFGFDDASSATASATVACPR